MRLVRRSGWGIAVALACVTIALLLSRRYAEPKQVASPVRPASPPPVAFVGEEVCASCHQSEAARWKGSQHQLAMQPASSSTVLGNFEDATFTHAGIESRFFRRDGKFVVRTDGPDGELREYEITHSFGLSPLQQYLVAFPGGRFQALEIAWDSRPTADGGQRWLHLLPGEHITGGDPLHWTGVTQNWNYMCSDCHSTNVRKSYDAGSDTYATTFAAPSVSCEACHGPGSAHVVWARKEGGSRDHAELKGLLIALDERKGVSWNRDGASSKPRRSKARTTEREIEMCARCHARRGLIHEDHVRGQRLGDDYRVALLDDELYHPDGQIKGEVYEYGSFVQSRMYAEGVTCSDCHDPHRPELDVSDGALCLRCHSPEYSSTRHHFHSAGSTGAQCVACHMPPTTYMVVDPRRDHSLRVPRPDLSVKLGVPNACNQCHTDRTATWAASTLEKWYGHTPSGHQQFADALAAGTRGTPGAQRLLAALVDDRRQPAIARASALERMAHQLTTTTLPSIRSSLSDPDPLVRRAAVQALAGVDSRLQLRLVLPLLRDPVRSVRIEAAAALGDVQLESLLLEDRAALETATKEFIAVQELNADRPEAHLALARHHVRQQRIGAAETELKRALAIDPAYVPAVVNLADLYRATARDHDGERMLREALRRLPDHPTLLHALGLVMVREKRLDEAADLLGSAARLGAENPRFGYVYGVALHDLGRREESLQTLEAVISRHPYDRGTLAALASFHREAGAERKARQYTARLDALEAL